MICWLIKNKLGRGKSHPKVSFQHQLIFHIAWGATCVVEFCQYTPFTSLRRVICQARHIKNMYFLSFYKYYNKNFLKNQIFLFLVPAAGFEPASDAVWRRCSTVELHRHMYHGCRIYCHKPKRQLPFFSRHINYGIATVFFIQRYYN